MARFEKLTVTQLDPGKAGGPAPVKLPSYTLATVPPAADWEGHMIWISDATPANLAVSNGTNWIAADDGLTAA